jgi:hypothetical protein
MRAGVTPVPVLFTAVSPGPRQLPDRQHVLNKPSMGRKMNESANNEEKSEWGSGTRVGKALKFVTSWMCWFCVLPASL